MKCFIAVYLSLVFVAPSMAGHVTTTGKEWGLWTEDRYSVIVASIHDITRTDDPEPNDHRATLRPLATIAGTLDPRTHPLLPVRLYAVADDSSIKRLPPDGATVLAVVRADMQQGHDQEPSNWVVSDTCTFMPEMAAMVTLRDARDPYVRETLKRIQEARADPDPNPYPTTSATAPNLRLPQQGSSFDGQSRITGVEPGVWTDGRYSVVVGCVRDIKPWGGLETDQYQATFLPLLRLAGTLDPSVSAKLRVRFFALSDRTSIKQLPPEGATVLAVVRAQVRRAKEPTLSDWIVPDTCTFMPDMSAMVTLRDERDPRISDTLRRLQGARANGDPEPHVRPATQPP